ncbi:hypothetical protein [Sphingobium lignivorans]|uniref:YD repeat-containing protein n=1 Tax=Sphingobium lignivorans TaxID=2735886 RepID=A0ABR6NH77_9SPHN|nr:hypothetical protein [Sphingobium lignivorans]MBB5986638.1 YD repeat-containing protein [Sphingobium lignivorans]
MKSIQWLPVLGLLWASSSPAAETTKYKYDARGRLIEVKQEGGPADGATSTYSYDAADNRTNVTVDAPVRVMVLPLNGFTIIPLN